MVDMEPGKKKGDDHKHHAPGKADVPAQAPEGSRTGPDQLRVQFKNGKGRLVPVTFVELVAVGARQGNALVPFIKTEIQHDLLSFLRFFIQPEPGVSHIAAQTFSPSFGQGFLFIDPVETLSGIPFLNGPDEVPGPVSGDLFRSHLNLPAGQEVVLTIALTATKNNGLRIELQGGAAFNCPHLNHHRGQPGMCLEIAGQDYQEPLSREHCDAVECGADPHKKGLVTLAQAQHIETIGRNVMGGRTEGQKPEEGQGKLEKTVHGYGKGHSGKPGSNE